MNIAVIDSIMGSGKTTWAFRYMNNHPECRWIYVAPYLVECSRAKENCPQLHFQEPEESKSKIHKKSDHYLRLIEKGRNIATTHALFLLIEQTPELLESIREKRYNLIIDEALDTVVNEKINRGDISLLLSSGMIHVDEQTQEIIWLNAEYQGSFTYLKQKCLTGKVYRLQQDSEDKGSDDSGILQSSAEAL